MEYTTILFEQIGKVAKITLNRPEQRNAQNGSLIAELHDAMARADRDEDIHVVTLLGAGPAFSAGHDLKDRSASGPFAGYDREAFNGQLQYADDILFGYWMFIHDLRKPTIAGVHGFVATAGISLAAMCDLIVAADDAKFLDHAVTLFATPGTELGWYPWEIGVRKAKEFLWTQPIWDAATMERLGLVNRVVPRADLEATVMAMAEQIALASPLAVQLTKKSIKTDAWLSEVVASHRRSRVTAPPSIPLPVHPAGVRPGRNFPLAPHQISLAGVRPVAPVGRDVMSFQFTGRGAELAPMLESTDSLKRIVASYLMTADDETYDHRRERSLETRPMSNVWDAASGKRFAPAEFSVARLSNDAWYARCAKSRRPSLPGCYRRLGSLPSRAPGENRVTGQTLVCAPHLEMAPAMMGDRS